MKSLFIDWSRRSWNDLKFCHAPPQTPGRGSASEFHLTPSWMKKDKSIASPTATVGAVR